MRHDEDALQRAVCEYLDLMGWRWCHVPNGGKRWKREAARFKGLGVKPGAPDILVFEGWSALQPTSTATKGTDLFGGHGIAIELKSEKGRLTPEQRDWLDALEQRGWYCQVCRSLDEVIEVCRRIR